MDLNSTRKMDLVEEGVWKEDEYKLGKKAQGEFSLERKNLRGLVSSPTSFFRVLRVS